MIVQVINNDLHHAVRALKLKISKDGLLSEIRRRQGHLSRTERRKVKDALAHRRKQKHSRLKVWKGQEKKRHGR